MSTDTLTYHQAKAVGVILDAVDRGARVRWDQEGRLLNGVARHLTTNVDGYFLDAKDDVRNAFLRISSTFEYFLPVREVIALIHDGLFAVDK